MLFVDMDGVLADFDQHYEDVFGVRSSKEADNVNWEAVREVPDFYLNIPPMKDLNELWDFIKHLNPVVLTGCPHSINSAANEKHQWIEKHLGYRVPVICTRSRNKWKFANAGSHGGNILIDDWEKYRTLWIGNRGTWITHTSAQDTIKQLKAMGISNGHFRS